MSFLSWYCTKEESELQHLEQPFSELAEHITPRVLHAASRGHRKLNSHLGWPWAAHSISPSLAEDRERRILILRVSVPGKAEPWCGAAAAGARALIKSAVIKTRAQTGEFV